VFQSVFLRSTPPSPGESKLPSRESFPEPLLTGQRAVIGGEALNATFGPATSRPTNSATSNAASKLPPNYSEKTNVGFVVHHFQLLHGNSRCMKRFLPYLSSSG
jgi:hypothetical protein